MSIPFDAAELSAQVFQSLSDQDELALVTNEFDQLDDRSIDQIQNQLAPSDPTSDHFDLRSISDFLHQPTASDQRPQLFTHHPSIDPDGAITLDRSTAQEPILPPPDPQTEPQPNHPSPSSDAVQPPSISYELRDFDETQVSELIESILRETHPATPFVPPSATPSSSVTNESAHTPMPPPILNPDPIPSSSHPHAPPMILDPTLDSQTTSTSPTTPSVPPSPQPSLRSDASTSQVPPTKTALQSDASQPSTLVPVNIRISSLDQLSNPPVGQQPNYPWWTIIRAAIMGSRYGIMRREEIYEALQNRWEYFRSTSESATRVWKSAVGHNLSVKECFVRVHVEGKRNVSYYIVDTAVDPAKGRLSKNKNPSSTDRMSVPTIARKLVLPPGFDLSIQARWSPAIAAIRNAKYGIPRRISTHISSHRRRSATSSSDISHTQSESDPTSGSEPDESSDELNEADTIANYLSKRQPSSFSRLTRRPGSSLSAIIEPTTCPRRTAHPVPRLAFSRSLSNALVAVPPPFRRRNFATRSLHSSGNQSTTPRSSTSRTLNPSVRPPAIPRSVGDQSYTISQQSPCISAPCPPFPSQSPCQKLSSLQDHVDAALADVAASLPQIVEEDSRADFDEGGMMIDTNLSILDPLPEIDLEAILREAHAEIQSEEIQAAHNINNQDSDHHAGSEAQDSTPTSLVPTAADFDRFLAAVISEYEHEGPNDGDSVPNPECQASVRNRGEHDGSGPRDDEAEGGGLNDLLQNLIDEATHESGREVDRSAQPADEITGPDDSSGSAFLEASRILEAEIERALKLAEEQEMLRQTTSELQQGGARQRTFSEQVSASLQGVVQLTASGDIPVHPLPLDSTIAPTTATIPLEIEGPSIRTVPRVSRGAERDSLQTKALPKSVAAGRKLTSARPNSSLINICLPNPAATTTARNESSMNVDRRTRASGTRTIGRKLNLPLPLSHTTPSTTTMVASTTMTVCEDNRVDETALAPSFLESIQVVSVDRPRSTFPELAKEAITSHPHGKMTAAEIFKVLEKKYPYFVTAPESWKATLRNVLTSHSCFVKIPRPPDAPGRGDWWSTVDLPLWKRRRTTAKAKQDEDFIGRYAREQSRKTTNNHDQPHVPDRSPASTTANNQNHDVILLPSLSADPVAHNPSSDTLAVAIPTSPDQNPCLAASTSTPDVRDNDIQTIEANDDPVVQREEGQTQSRKRKQACSDENAERSETGIEINQNVQDQNPQGSSQRAQLLGSNNSNFVIDEQLLSLTTSSVMRTSQRESNSENGLPCSAVIDSLASINDSIHPSIQSHHDHIPHHHSQLLNDLTVV